MEEKGSFTKHIKSVLTSYMYFRFKTAIFFFWGGGYRVCHGLYFHCFYLRYIFLCFIYLI